MDAIEGLSASVLLASGIVVFGLFAVAQVMKNMTVWLVENLSKGG